MKVRSKEKKLEILVSNLIEQIDSIKKNRYSYLTKTTYRNSQIRFIKWAVCNYRLHNLRNIDVRHIRAYIKYLQKNGNTNDSIIKELYGIYYYNKILHGKNKIPKIGEMMRNA